MPFRPFPGKKRAAQPRLFAGQEPAPETRLLAHVDGGARGNPGPAGYGVVIADQAGRPLARLSRYLGHRTNNYAEYMGLLAALEYALEHGPRALQVASDSELLVRQINGHYKVRSPHLKELHAQAQSLIRRLDWFAIEHVPRARNKEADRLANLAMDEGMKRD
jgi:ribonuclease HI